MYTEGNMINYASNNSIIYNIKITHFSAIYANGENYKRILVTKSSHRI